MHDIYMHDIYLFQPDKNLDILYKLFPSVAQPTRQFSPAIKIFVFMDCENNQFPKK